jgi:hypothetical protein
MKRYLVVILIILGICIILFFSLIRIYNFIEVGVTLTWTLKYFALAIFFVVTVVCFYVYSRFSTKTVGRYRVRVSIGILFLSLIFTIFFSLVTPFIIVVSNIFLGSNTLVQIDGKVVDSNRVLYSRKKFYFVSRRSYYIKIQDKDFDRIIELKVPRRYQIGESFCKTMNIGKWGIIIFQELS